MESVEAVVIGAGVVGLACARALAQAGREVVVLEAAGAIGTGISSRNSEVLHAGLYYPTGSLKAQLCVQGRRMLVDFCERHGVAHRLCGKVVVATEESQVPALQALLAQAIANGVDDVEPLTREQAVRLEPQLRCVAALHSPSTGIVDSHGLMLALQGGAEALGATVVLRSPVLGGRIVPGGVQLRVGGESPFELQAGLLVNCAGLHATQVARSVEGLDPRHVPTPRYSKGSYFGLAGRTPFSRLVYPMHEGAWLGVHLTLDLAGQARFGPDAEWLPEGVAPEAVDTSVDPARAAAFAEAVRHYWPGLPEGALQPAYAGIRPKIHGPGEPAPDFTIQGEDVHGVQGLVNLFGIESPGLTSSLAIGARVATMSA